MLTIKSFALSLSVLFIYFVSFAMEDKITKEDEHYNVFKAVQIIKKLFIEELNQMKDSIPAKFHEDYEKYKETILNLTLEPKQFYFFQIQGLIVHFSNDLKLLTYRGELNFTAPLKGYQEIGTDISSQAIAKFLRNFENKLLNHGELSIEESSNSAITYKVHSIGEIILPEPIVTAHESTFYVTENSRKLWQAMEKKYKEENNQLS